MADVFFVAFNRWAVHAEYIVMAVDESAISRSQQRLAAADHGAVQPAFFLALSPEGVECGHVAIQALQQSCRDARLSFQRRLGKGKKRNVIIQALPQPCIMLGHAANIVAAIERKCDESGQAQKNRSQNADEKPLCHFNVPAIANRAFRHFWRCPGSGG